MPESAEKPKEIPLELDEVNEINSAIVKRMSGFLKEYPNIKELLNEGSVDLLDPSRSLLTANWKYIFTRPVSEYLQLFITKRPLSEDSDTVEERVDIVYGENPLIQHDITLVGKPKEAPQRNTSEAAKKVMAFLSEFESQL